MKLKSIEVQGLYGTLSRKVDFNSDLNLLVGINGSGKTSLLNCIDCLLRPDLAALANVQFRFLRLDFSHEGSNYSLLAEQRDNVLYLSRLGGEYLPPITVNMVQNSSRHELLTVSEYRKRGGFGLTPEPHERALWNFLQELPHPLTISLDRSISAETEDGTYFDPGASARDKRERKTKAPLEKVVEVTRRQYANFKFKIFQLNEELKAKMVVSAFRNPFFDDDRAKDRKKRKISLGVISALEQKVSLLLSSSLGNNESSQQITKYFHQAKDFARISAEDERLRDAFWLQFKQIDELTQAFDAYEKEASSAYERLGSYVQAVNSFFVESLKAVDFSEEDAGLVFKFLGKDLAPERTERSVANLSSGEKQILILLTFLAFVCEPGQVFIVDEPELSLHPRWQQKFLDAVISQAPADTQIILASHSPEIVAKHKNSCIVLAP